MHFFQMQAYKLDPNMRGINVVNVFANLENLNSFLVSLCRAPGCRFVLPHVGRQENQQNMLEDHFARFTTPLKIHGRFVIRKDEVNRSSPTARQSTKGKLHNRRLRCLSRFL